MSQLPYLIILTSSNCGACKFLHNTGSFSRTGETLNNKDIRGFKWNAASLWKLITASDKPKTSSPIRFNVFEFEFYDMNRPTLDNVKSFTIFKFQQSEDEPNKGDILRDIYDRVTIIEEGISKLTDEYVLTKDDGDDVNKEPQEGSFNEFLSKYFPNMLSLYAVQFPSLIFIDNTEMKKALKDKNFSPYALSYGLIINKVDDKWKATKRDDMKEEWKSTFVSYTKHVSDNLDLLIPPKDVPEIAKEEKQKKAVKINEPKKSILKGSEANIEPTSEKCVSYPIKVVPLNPKYSFNSY